MLNTYEYIYVRTLEYDRYACVLSLLPIYYLAWTFRGNGCRFEAPKVLAFGARATCYVLGGARGKRHAAFERVLKKNRGDGAKNE